MQTPLTDAGEGRFGWCPRQDSNLRTRLRRAVLYPLSYGGGNGTNDTSSGDVPAHGLGRGYAEGRD